MSKTIFTTAAAVRKHLKDKGFPLDRIKSVRNSPSCFSGDPMFYVTLKNQSGGMGSSLYSGGSQLPDQHGNTDTEIASVLPQLLTALTDTNARPE